MDKAEENPPNYDQVIGPGFLPIGTPEDLAQAAQLAGSSRVYAALRPTEDSLQKLTNVLLGFVAIPCLWGYLPCLLLAVLNQRALFRNTLYIITEDSVFISVGDYTPPCSSGCTTGRDSMEISFDSITDVVVDNRGRGCTFCRPPYVILTLINKRVTLLVENTEGVAHLIRELRRADRNRRGGPAAVIQQPITVIQGSQGSQPKRIFVATESDPAAVSIVNLVSNSTADWNKFHDDIRGTLGLPAKTEVKLVLADFGARITAADQLSANDKITVTAIC